MNALNALKTLMRDRVGWLRGLAVEVGEAVQIEGDWITESLNALKALMRE